MKADDKEDIESGFIESPSPYAPIEGDDRKPNQEGLRYREPRLHGGGMSIGCGLGFGRDFPRE